MAGEFPHSDLSRDERRLETGYKNSSNFSISFQMISSIQINTKQYFIFLNLLDNYFSF